MAYQMSAYLLILKTSLNPVVYASLTRNHSQSSQIEVFEFVQRAVSFFHFITCAFVFFWGKELIYFVLGEEWLNIETPLKVFFVVALVRGISGSVNPLLFVNGITKAELNIGAINLLLLIPAIYVGAISYGIIGASLGVLAVSIVTGVLMFYIYIRKITRLWGHYLFGPLIILLSMHISNELVSGYKLLSALITLFLFYQIYIKFFRSYLKKYGFSQFI